MKTKEIQQIIANNPNAVFQLKRNRQQFVIHEIIDRPNSTKAARVSMFVVVGVHQGEPQVVWTWNGTIEANTVKCMTYTSPEAAMAAEVEYHESEYAANIRRRMAAIHQND